MSLSIKSESAHAGARQNMPRFRFGRHNVIVSGMNTLGGQNCHLIVSESLGHRITPPAHGDGHAAARLRVRSHAPAYAVVHDDGFGAPQLGNDARDITG